MKLSILEIDIAQGIACSADRCPIANAVRRTVPDLSDILVTQSTVRYRNASGAWCMGFLSTRAIRMVNRYDNGGEFSPMTIALNFWEEPYCGVSVAT